MSQKTNPVSLRLQKNNQNFALPWFADFFFTENYHYGFEIENYIAAFLRETQYSKAFFSAKSLYRKFSIFLFIQDARLDKKEKQLSFKLKPYKILKSSKNYSSSTVLKLLQENRASNNFSIPLEKNFKSWVQKNICTLLLLDHHQRLYLSERQQFRIETNQKTSNISDYTFSRIFDKIPKRDVASAKLKKIQILPKIVPLPPHLEEQTSFICDVKKKEKGFAFLNMTMMKECFRKQIRNNFLRIKQNYPYSFYTQTFLHSKAFKNIGLRKVDQNKKDIKQNFSELPLELLDVRRKAHTFGEAKPNLVPFGCLSAKILSFPKTSVKPTFSSSCEANLKVTLLDHLERKKDDVFTFTKAYGESDAFNPSEANALTKSDARLSVKVLPKVKCKIFGANRKKVDFPGTNGFSPVTVNFELIRFIKNQQNVMSLLDQIIILLEKRISFRQIKSKLFKDLVGSAKSEALQIKGVRISCSGRLGGRSKKAQKAKMQSDSWGETSLNAFSSKLLFGSKSAYTSYGKVGVKLWVCFQNDRC